ncbi:cell cycle checkpoint protein [Rhizoctonia solani AG-1 IB]|uniref:Cell cycle checkpoint protein n=2 Tax=Thanatephorus cucumeris (strain AG1-IB / isolate 7/3/14) TaxID=1108050 RepID=M5BHV2_THACB|nr:cell cycle checkpoint protein [Rhizoctonia solani AG-1 IB]
MSQQATLEVLQASVNDVRHLASMIRGVAFVNRATISISEAGITVTVEEARSLIANAYIPYTLFSNYTFNPPSGDAASSQASDSQPPAAVFEVQLDVLLECLNIFGTASGNLLAKGGAGTEQKPRGKAKGKGKEWADLNANRLDNYFTSSKATALRMSYQGEGYPLTLLLAEDASGPKTTCEVTTLEPEPNLELPFDDDEKVVKLIMKMDYPNDREVLELFECVERVSFNYRYRHIARALRPLQSSLKVSLRIDRDGLLSLQFMMPASQGALIEFKCLALVEEA